MPDAYNPWGAPVFPTADENAMQPETFMPQGVRDWTQQAAPKDYNILSQIAGSLGKALMYPGQVAQSQVPISTEDMVGPAFNLAGMLTLGAGAAPQEANALNMGIRAYHGSPHDFDKFDLSKIGTGEGAQAYGHGLYFADSEGVAKSYRDALSNGFVTQDGSPLTGPVRDAAKYIKEHGSIPNALRDLEERSASYKSAHGGDWSPYDESLSTLKTLDPTSIKGSGHMYEVNINADPSHFLDWDKSLSEQSPKIQEAFKDVPQAPDIPGQLAYYRMAGRKLQSPETSAKLAEAGIPGIKYLDQGSRGAGEGSSNYVVFNHDLIDIMRKYAVPGMLGAPILANALSEQKT